MDLVLGISLGLVKVFSGCFELSLETLDLGLAAQESIHTPVLATGKLSGEVRYKPCLLVIAEKLHSPAHGFAESNRVAATTCCYYTTRLVSTSKQMKTYLFDVGAAVKITATTTHDTTRTEASSFLLVLDKPSPSCLLPPPRRGTARQENGIILKYSYFMP